MERRCPRPGRIPSPSSSLPSSRRRSAMRDETVGTWCCRGGSAPIGHPMKLGAELAVEEINAAGGIGGRRVALVARDDYASPDSAVLVANELYLSNVSAVVGHLYSGTTLAAAPVYNGGANPLVAISPSSSAPTSATRPWTSCRRAMRRMAPRSPWVGSAWAHAAASCSTTTTVRRGVRSRSRRSPAAARARASTLPAARRTRRLSDHVAADGKRVLVVAGDRSEAKRDPPGRRRADPSRARRRRAGGSNSRRTRGGAPDHGVPAGWTEPANGVRRAYQARYPPSSRRTAGRHVRRVTG